MGNGGLKTYGDFDLLIGAYKNNLKITEVPITYFERIEVKQNDFIICKYFKNDLDCNCSIL